jgi:hypothetical protein
MAVTTRACRRFDPDPNDQRLWRVENLPEFAAKKSSCLDPNFDISAVHPASQTKAMLRSLPRFEFEGRLTTRRAVLAGGIALCGTFERAFGEPLRLQRVARVTSGPGVLILEWIRGTLRTPGYEEGKNLVIDFREASGHYAELPKLLAEVTALNPDVIVAEATPAVAAAQQLTSTIPIVMAPSTDPVGPGFVKSFARPGGNITGVANMFDDTTAKTLDIALFSPT